MANAASVSATGNAEIDGLLSGVKWSGTISYSFPTSASLYPSPYSSSNEPSSPSFAAAPVQMQTAINYAVALIQSYTNASITYNGSGSADIMVAQSSASNPTSKAYYPSSSAAGGDVWFGIGYDYTQAKLGNYYFVTALHELGHAFGLKHSQETGGPANVAVPTAHDDSEYTVMSYRSYVGASTTSGYTNEAYGYSQTYMANDILALQTMYGADYTTQSGNTVYTWSPTTGQEFINGVGQLADGGGVGGSANRIYETVWDGGGIDTYDLSNYTTNLSINLNPGASSVFSSTQLAYLGNGNYAAGNVYNAYLYNGDTRSYIDNAIGGSGNDTIIGNAIANVLNGGSGNDTITGGGGNDTIIGGAGTDTAVYSGNRANYAIAYNSSSLTFTVTDQRTNSPDGTDTVSGVEYFQFADGAVASSYFIAFTIEALGTTSLVQSGDHFYLNPVAGGTGPVLMFGPSPLSASSLGGWGVIGAEQIAGGYEVALHSLTSDQYTVWTTDNGGNVIGNATGGIVSGASLSLQSLEASFHQDLNGDGTIGIPGRVIEALGVTSLAQVGDNYFLNPAAGGTGPVLMFGTSPLSAASLGGWAVIGAEQISGGYEVALHSLSSDQYTVWITDSGGNVVGNGTGGVVSGGSSVLQTLEPSFHQDLNGDGTVGIAGRVIEALGSTSLVQIGDNFHLNPVSGGAGPVLMFGPSPLSASSLGGWAVIGAEQTAGGYLVALHSLTADQYTVWTTDSGGNVVGNATGGIVSGGSSVLQSLESSFHQDLNGDATIGVISSAGRVIESFGSTSLVQVGDNFRFNPVSGGTGPILMFGPSPLSASSLGGWTVIAAEQTAGGYLVALHSLSADQYTVWTTDSGGNVVGNATGGIVTGASTALKSLEASFQQDLNADGHLGMAVPHVLAATENAHLTGFL